MTAQELLKKCEAEGVALKTNRGQIDVDWNKSRRGRDEDLARQIVRNKPEILRLLGDKFVPLSREEVLNAYANRLETKEDKRGWIFTGIPGFDGTSLGTRPHYFAILGARPHVGKTGFMIQWADNIAMTVGPVLVITCEQSTEDLSERILSQAALVSKAGHTPQLARREAARKWPVFYHEGQTRFEDVVELIQRMRVLWRQLAAVFIDYLGLLRAPEGRYGTSEEKISAISQGLKNLALAERVPIIALHQLNRDTNKSVDRKPTIDNLRGSGQLEQDADQIALMWRPDLKSNKVEIDFAKNRNQGKLGVIHLLYDQSTGRFTDDPDPTLPKPTRPQAAPTRGHWQDDWREEEPI